MDDPKPEVIEQDMAQTRSSLVEKIAALEQQVVATVQSATTAVQDTVQSVTHAVQDTTSSVKESLLGVQDAGKEAIQGLTGNVKEVFDLSTHTQNSPWAMLGGAAAVGFVTGLAVFGPRTRSLPGGMSDGSEPRGSSGSYSGGGSGLAPNYLSYQPAAAAPAAPAAPSEPSWIDRLFGMAGAELLKLGEQALSKAVTQAKTAIDQNVPKLVDTLVASGAERVGLVGDQPSRPR